LAQPPEFAHAQMDVPLLPGVEGGLGHTELPTEITDRRARLGLTEGVDNLLFGKLRPLHGSAPFARDRRSRHPTLLL